ncbi:MAG: HAD-IA family hydrolase [Rhodospirillales bacterium]|jgi:phosphoglycolate phosphatase|nr:HAD-IA family hydrolase [Rhodospirillales bacterium]
MLQTAPSSPSTALRLAVFDVDGTLIDSQNSIVSAMSHAWQSHGLVPPERATTLRMVGLPLAEVIAGLAPGESPERWESLRTSYSSEWSRMRDQGRLSEPLFPGAISVLDDLEEAGWLLGVATGKSRRGLDMVLAAHGLADRFVTLQTSDVSAGKPNPEMLMKAMAETGAAPASTAMIGDTTYDVQMARNAGIHAIGVAWGYHDVSELKAAGAHAIIDDFSELPGILDGLMAEAVR